MTIIRRIALLTFLMLIVLPMSFSIAAPVDRPLMQPPDTNKNVDGSSEAHTFDLAAGTPADPYPLAIGEVVTYRLVVEMPEGISPDVQFHDTLAQNIEFITGSARVSYSANNAFTGTGTVGINEINPTTAIPAGQITFGVTAPRELTFDLGEIINNDSDLNAEILVIEYQAVVVNTSDNVAGATFANNFSVDLNNDGTDDDTSNDTNHVIVEPNLTISKAVNTTLSNPSGTTTFDGGDTVVYDIVITNPSSPNGATAFDLRLLDSLNIDLDLISVSFIGTPAYATTADNSIYIIPIQIVDATISELRQGDSITVRVTVTVRNTVTLGQTISTPVTLAWTSLPGERGTGNATPGASGATNGERNGNSTGENDYFRIADTSISIFDGLPIKRIAGTSNSATSDSTADTPTDPRPVLIGETITYRLEAVLPESTTISFSLEDILPSGLQFVVGSARVSYSANNAPTFGDTAFSGIPNSPTPTLAFLFPAGNIVPIAGGFRFDFGSIINNDGDSNAEFIYLEFDVLVLNDVVNTTGSIKINEFDVIIDEGLPTEDTTTSNLVYAIIVDPPVGEIDLSVSKSINITAPQIGDFIVYTVTIQNDGAVDATGVELTDTLPSTVTYSGVHTASQGTFNGSVWTLADPIPPNGSAELLITVQVTSNVGTFVNTAEITAADQPDVDSTPNNGVTTEDDYAEAVFIFDPPFGRKTFNDAGLPELEWTIVWVNPSGLPVDVTISDPLLAGTTFIAGSLTCTSPGTITVNNCDYDALNNEIVFDGTIFPDFGATPATIDSATNPLIITYRVGVPDSVDTVFNEATLTNANGDVVVSETFIRQPVTITEEPPVPTAPTDPPTTTTTTSSADLALLATAKALPATGEAPVWRDALIIGLLGLTVLGLTFVVWRKRVISPR